jgi:hypothetical protein
MSSTGKVNKPGSGMRSVPFGMHTSPVSFLAFATKSCKHFTSVYPHTKFLLKPEENK